MQRPYPGKNGLVPIQDPEQTWNFRNFVELIRQTMNFTSQKTSWESFLILIGILSEIAILQTLTTSMQYSSVSVYWEEFVSDWVGARASLLSRLGSTRTGLSKASFLQESGRFWT